MAERGRIHRDYRFGEFMIAIVDYGMGNLRSVHKAFEHVGAQAQITYRAYDISKADKVVLPGVGAIAPAMAQLNQLGLVDTLKTVIADGKPFLGICLGMQLLFERSSEGGTIEGLGIFSGTVERLAQGKVPHMGWNQVNITAGKETMYSGIVSGADMYFCHSYRVIPENTEVIASLTEYGLSIVSSVLHNNVWGVQFHPEKSQTNGLQVLKNFKELT